MVFSDLAVWVLQRGVEQGLEQGLRQGLENRYGPLMGVGLMCCVIGLRWRAHGVRAWSTGGVLIALAYLVQH